MLDDEPTSTVQSDQNAAQPAVEGTAAQPRRRRVPAKKAAAPAAIAEPPGVPEGPAAPPDERPAAPTRRRTARKAAAAVGQEPTSEPVEAETAPTARASRRRAAKAAAPPESPVAEPSQPVGTPPQPVAASAQPAAAGGIAVLFQAPAADVAPIRSRRLRGETVPAEAEPTVSEPAAPSEVGAEPGDRETGSRRRRRGGRGRRSQGEGGEVGDGQPASAARGDEESSAEHADESAGEHAGEPDGQGTEEYGSEDRRGDAGSSRRRRRRRRRGPGGESEEHAGDDPPNTVVRIREPREHDDHGGVQGVKGSTRLEAKKQRRREGREQIRRGRRGLVITEAEFLARRESVDRVMVVRQRDDRTQIGVLEDGILVEHFVSTASSNRMVGNVYLGRVQNVLPGMEAAFVDIGKGRNAVLYAGEVNFDATDMEGQPRRIESALKSGQSVLVQVTKDPIGHKGARLTSQVSLPGRFLVYVPEGSMMGISRKLPDVERSRLKAILKEVMPEGAGVIVRTAAEGASEEELARDVARLAAQWEDIKKKSETASTPSLLYGEPDLTIRVIRDVFNEDFNSLVVQADSEWDTVEAYVGHVAPDLVSRLSRWTSEGDVFDHYRVDEQLAKALDRKVWLPSGGYLIIDRTEAMVVIDVNTGRFVGKGGNLEETVTKNNLEAAEEIVRQLRLRDVGGIIVIDFIDMVLESNRELVLRRLVECLGRDRTKHQVAEVTSLGLVQMTRKRVGTGLLEAFSEVCEHCNGRGVIVHTEPVEHRPSRSLLPKPAPPRGGRRRGAHAAAVELPATADTVAANGAPAEADPAESAAAAADSERVAASDGALESPQAAAAAPAQDPLGGAFS